LTVRPGRTCEHSAAFLAAVALFTAMGCGESPATPGEEFVFRPDAAVGAAAFAESCASCHAARDGLDLAYFSYPDTTIMRRAVAHVDSGTGRHIIAHIRRSLSGRVPRDHRLFQPGGTVLENDVQFAVRLFGADAWPADLTRESLLKIDPRSVVTAVPFPRWSDESGNLDWMPETPIPDGLLEHGDRRARTALDTYYANRSMENLRAAVSALRSAERDSTSAAAPCVRPPLARFRASECFELRRWTATLIAQHMLRTEGAEWSDSVFHNAWWDVGDAVRIGIARDGAFDNGVANWASWMYLGWSFGAIDEPSVWLGEALARAGLGRHAVFTIVRSQAARARHSPEPYDDLTYAVQFAPDAWTFAVARFGLTHLLERVDAGDIPAAGRRRDQAILALTSAFQLALPDVTVAEREILSILKDRILARLR
jgi:hypothetical protein